MISVNTTSKKNFSIYDVDEKYINEYNKISKSKLNEINKMMKKGFFVVPSIYFDQAWGKEKVFIPFTNKLYKVIESNKGDTSLQIHPIKTEQYIALNDKTNIFDGIKTNKLKKGDIVKIKNNTLHSLKVGSKVFEEQDNNIFDQSETIRIKEYLGRKENTPIEYYKYLLPHIQNKIKFINKSDNYYINNDKFLFLIDGYVLIEYEGIEHILNKIEELYFLDKNVSIKKISGNVSISKISYYNMVEYEV